MKFLMTALTLSLGLVAAPTVPNSLRSSKKSCPIPFVTTGLNGRAAAFSIPSLVLFFLLALPPAVRAADPATGFLSATANGLVFDARTQHQLDSSFNSNSLSAGSGPVTATADAGANVQDDVDVYNIGIYDYAIAARAFATADYGVNGARAGSDLFFGGSNNSAVPGYTSAFFAVPFTMVDAGSQWQDGFVINGGTGFATATVTLLLDGRFFRDSYVVQDASTELYLTAGSAGVGYGLTYNDFVHAGGETGYEQSVLSWNRDRAAGEIILGEGPIFSESLTGSFAFEYGVPFMLTSDLNTSTTGDFNADFSSTATLSLFTLPQGASLVAGSGSYNASTVPVPAAVWLFGSGLLALIGVARRKKK